MLMREIFIAIGKISLRLLCFDFFFFPYTLKPASGSKSSPSTVLDYRGGQRNMSSAKAASPDTLVWFCSQRDLSWHTVGAQEAGVG